MAFTEIFQIIDGFSRKAKAKKELRGLADPKYMSATDIWGKANSMADGYSAQEENAFRQGLARQTNTAYSKAISVNPTGSGAITSALSFLKPQALNQFAAQDTAIKRGQVSELARLIGGQDQLTQGLLIGKHQALGQAAQDARQSIFSGIKGIENEAKDVVLMLLGMPPTAGR